MKRIFFKTLLAISTLAVTTLALEYSMTGGNRLSVKEFFMEYRIKFHQEGTHITSITLDRKGKESGNAYFHGGECYALMLTVARGPGSRVNFEKDVSTTADNIWVDKVTGNRLKGDESEQIWRFEVDDKSEHSDSHRRVKRTGQTLRSQRSTKTGAHKRSMKTNADDLYL